MMGFSKIITTLIAILLITAPVYASNQNQEISKTRIDLFEIQYIIKDGRAYQVELTVNTFSGKSASAPCSDMTLIYTASGKGKLEPMNRKIIDSDHLLKNPGPGYSCIRSDLVVNGKTYSTGNIELKWDAANNSYVDANPKLITVIFDLTTSDNR